MQLDDRLTIRTPEGVELSLTLAGLGGRILAATIDLTIQVIAIVIVALAASAWGDETGMVGLGLLAAFSFLVFFGYSIMFEVLNGGRTIGKRAVGLRVVRKDGGPIGFGAATLRSIFRLLDMSLGIGPIAILATKDQQRLGDLVAGTVVIRERLEKVPTPTSTAERSPPEGPRWDVSAITAEEVAVIRRFMERRSALPAARRAELAAGLAAKIRAKVVSPGGHTGTDEDYLARVAAEKG